MSRKERSEEQKKICEKDILKAAEKVFLRNGFENTTMEEIAHEADYTKRTLYSYFESKEEIFLSIITNGFRLLNELVGAILSSGEIANGLEKVRLLGEAYYSFYKQYPDYFRIIAEYKNREQDFSGNDQTARECYVESEKSVEALKAALNEGSCDGSIRIDTGVDITALLLWGQLYGTILIIDLKRNYIKAYYGKNDEEILTVLWSMIEKILK